MKGSAHSKAEAEQDTMSAWLDEYTPPRPCRRGDIVKGIIVRVDPKSFLVDIGGKSDAIVHPREVEQLTPEQLKAMRPGQPIHVYVLDAGDKNNGILVSLAKAAQEEDWTRASELLESGETIELEVVDSNKGGLIVHLGQLRGFVPGSQLHPSWRPLQDPSVPERRWEAMIGKTLNLKVIEVTPQRNRLIFSERGTSSKTIDKREILESLEIGSVQEGVVSNVVDFGAFINIKGVDGLLHISELSWRRVNHPSEIVKPGQKLKVHILDIDLERERLNLSLKQLKADPWEEVAEIYDEGQLLDVEVVNITSFGAFVCPVDNRSIEGLVHISELSDQPVTRPDEVVQLGMQKVARIISLRPDDRRIAFSFKKVAPGESPETEDWQDNLAAVHEEETLSESSEEA